MEGVDEKDISLFPCHTYRGGNKTKANTKTKNVLMLPGYDLWYKLTQRNEIKHKNKNKTNKQNQTKPNTDSSWLTRLINV